MKHLTIRGAAPPTRPSSAAASPRKQRDSHHILKGALPPSHAAFAWSTEELARRIRRKIDEKCRPGPHRMVEAFQLFQGPSRRKGTAPVSMSEFQERCRRCFGILIDDESCRDLFSLWSSPRTSGTSIGGGGGGGGNELELSFRDFKAGVLAKDYTAEPFHHTSERDRVAQQHRAMREGVEVIPSEMLPAHLRGHLQDIIVNKIRQHVPPGRHFNTQAFRLFRPKATPRERPALVPALKAGAAGVITKALFRGRLQHWGILVDDSAIDTLFEQIDRDGDGVIGLDEFSAALIEPDYDPKRKLKEEDELRAKQRRVRDTAQAGFVLEELPAHLQKFRWSVDTLEEKIQQKCAQYAEHEADKNTNAFNMFVRGNIDGGRVGERGVWVSKPQFKARVAKFGILLNDEETDMLFGRYGATGEGAKIDMAVFAQAITEADYTDTMWHAASAERQEAEHRARIQEAVEPASTVPMEDWSLDEIERQVQNKIEQATSRSTDRQRQAFALFKRRTRPTQKKSRGITPMEFREQLAAFGFVLTDEQSNGLFSRYDTNASGDIDLKELIVNLYPPDYTAKQWAAVSEEREEAKRSSQTVPHSSVQECRWSTAEIERRLRIKIEERLAHRHGTSRHKAAWSLFSRGSSGVSIHDFIDRLNDFGIHLPKSDCTRLFDTYDIDKNGMIDVKEFYATGLVPDDNPDRSHYARAFEHSPRHRNAVGDIGKSAASHIGYSSAALRDTVSKSFEERRALATTGICDADEDRDDDDDSPRRGHSGILDMRFGIPHPRVVVANHVRQQGPPGGTADQNNAGQGCGGDDHASGEAIRRRVVERSQCMATLRKRAKHAAAGYAALQLRISQLGHARRSQMMAVYWRHIQQQDPHGRGWVSLQALQAAFGATGLHGVDLQTQREARISPAVVAELAKEYMSAEGGAGTVDYAQFARAVLHDHAARSKVLRSGINWCTPGGRATSTPTPTSTPHNSVPTGVQTWSQPTRSRPGHSRPRVRPGSRPGSTNGGRPYTAESGRGSVFAAVGLTRPVSPRHARASYHAVYSPRHARVVHPVSPCFPRPAENPRNACDAPPNGPADTSSHRGGLSCEIRAGTSHA